MMRKTKRQTTKNLSKIAKAVRRDIIEMCFRANVGHIAPALSIVDILTVLYYEILKVDSKNPQDPSRDRFILSKGHAAAALYATLFHKGFFDKKTLLSFCQDAGAFGVHPDYNLSYGVELTTGSLGHGLSVAAGLAFSFTYLQQKKERIPKVFVILSDAELNEGSTWEAIMFAAHHKLQNLIAIVDDNGLQAFGKTKHVLDLEPINKKFETFGWSTHNVSGNKIKALNDNLSSIPFQPNKPSALIAKTVGGKGISFMENALEWHYFSLSEELYKKAIQELS